MTRKILMSSLCAAAMSLGVAHAQTIVAGGSSLAAPTYEAEFALFSGPTWTYVPVGSGAGQKGFLSNNPNEYTPSTVPQPALNEGDITASSTVDLGASDAFLTSSQLTNAATGSYSMTTSGVNGNSSSYTGSSASSGPVIQLPTLGVPVALGYDNSGVKAANLVLTDDQVCEILSGKVKDWHAIVSTIPANTTIHVVVRADGSGTTFLLTQHLNAVCNASNSDFPATDYNGVSLPFGTPPITKYFYYNTANGSSNEVFHGDTPADTMPTSFTGEVGTGAVAAQMIVNATGKTTPYSFGYLSPDYTSIAPNSNEIIANPAYKAIKVVKLVNPNDGGLAFLPNVASTEQGLDNPGPGSNLNGVTTIASPTSRATAANPLNWVPAIPQTNAGYSIVGYTTILVSSCYQNKTVGTDLNSFLTDHYTNASYDTVIKNNGFAPLANTGTSKFITAIENDFLSNKAKYSPALNIDGTECTSYTGR